MYFKKCLNIIILISAIGLLSSCIGGGSDGGFEDLIGGNISDVDELTIISTSPSGNTLTIDVGDSQSFSILAQTPPPATVSYYFTLDGGNVSNTNTYDLTGTIPLIGNHTVTAYATDGTATKSKSWTVKVNGAPEVTGAYATAPKIAYAHPLALTVTGTDPNGDPMTWAWTLGTCSSGTGSASATLVGTNNTAIFTPDVSLVGCVKIFATATDDSAASDTYSFEVTVNAFDQSCNELAQFEMCTYVGTPSLGDELDPEDPSVSSNIKIGAIALAVDDRNNNIFFADWNHNLVWYWNRTSSAVNLLQFDTATAIPANTLKVIAGTGAAATESGDTSLNVGINGPRGLYYDSTNDRLYISEYSANRVKLVNSTGMTSYLLGVGAGNVNGTTATTHVCANPAGMSYYDPDGAGGVNGKLYVACYSSHLVKEWDLTTNLVNVVYGATSGNSTNFRNDRTAPTFAGAAYAGGAENGQAYAVCAANCGYPNPYNVIRDATGLYITHSAHHVVRYCNFSGGARDYFGTNVPNGSCQSILGTTANAFGAMPANPRATAFAAPSGIIVEGDKMLVSSISGNSDRIVLLNNTGANIPVGDYGVAINDNQFNAITSVAAGYTEGATASTKAINDPYDMIIEPDTAGYPRSYLIADYSNKRIRRFDYGSNLTVSVIGSGRLRADNVGATGVANSFYMNTPSGIVYDAATSVESHFIMDATNLRVIKVDKYGNVTTAVGGGANTPASVNGSQNPLSITMSTTPVTLVDIAMFIDKSFAINQRGYHHIQVWNRSGSTKAYLNGGTTGVDKVNQLAGNYNLPANAVPANYDNDANAMLVSLFHPSGIAISENQNTLVREVFISDEYRHCIRRVTEAGAMDTPVGVCKNGSQPNAAFPGQAEGGGGVGIDSDTPTNHTLYRPVGLAAHYPTSTDATDGGGVPASLTGDANLVIADYNNSKIKYWNRSGTAVEFASVTVANNTIETIGCTTGSANTSENIFAQGAQCSNPVGFAINNDYLCYSQWGKHNVRCIYLSGASEGRVFTVAGAQQAVAIGISGIPYNDTKEGTAGTAQRLFNPSGLTFDSSGDLFISDHSNHIVKKVKMAP